MKRKLVYLLVALTTLSGFVPGGLPSISPPSVLADGQPPALARIAFVSNRDSNYEIYVMNPDGSNQTRLTNDPAQDSYPSWSPDGTKIAFNSNRDGNSEIYIMNADGSGQTRLTSNSAEDVYPSWSPDGTKIAFESDRNVNNQIYVMNTDGSGQTNLSNNSAQDTLPSWSPDGTKIAFQSNRDSNWEIYVMNANGSGQTNLTNNAGPDGGYPAWSHDGIKIAFAPQRDSNSEVYSMNANGANQTRLTNNPAEDYHPTWCPDGARIAFNSNRDSNWEIYAMNADGSGQTRLTNNLADDLYPAWSPFLSGNPNTPNFTMSVMSNNVTVVKGQTAVVPVKIDFNPGFTTASGITFQLSGGNAPEGTVFTPVPLKTPGGVALKINTTNWSAGTNILTLQANEASSQPCTSNFTLNVITTTSITFSGNQTVISTGNVSQQGNIFIYASGTGSDGNPLSAPITLQSDNPNVLGVDYANMGYNIYGLQTGTANLIASAPDGFTANLTLNIDFPADPSITNISLTPVVGQTPQITNKYTGNLTFWATGTRPIGFSIMGMLSDNLKNNNMDWSPDSLTWGGDFQINDANPPGIGSYVFSAYVPGSGQTRLAEAALPLVIVNDPSYSTVKGGVVSLDPSIPGFALENYNLEFYQGGSLQFTRTHSMGGPQGAPGAFNMGAIPPGTYKIKYVPPVGGFGPSIKPQWYPNADNISAASDITFNAGQVTPNIYFFASAAPNLVSITVTPSNPSIPAGHTLQFAAIGNYTDNSTANITSDVFWTSDNTDAATISSGMATAVAPGSTTITAAQGFISSFTTLTVTSNVTPTGSISGYVYQSDNITPISGAQVLVYDYNNFKGNWVAVPAGSASSGVDGSYQVTSLGSGNYTVEAKAAGYSDKWYGDTYYRYSVTPVAVNALSDTSGVNFGLDAGGSLSGRVTLVDGVTPVANMTVMAFEPDHNALMDSAITDASGNYTITGMPDGSYKVKTVAWATGLTYIDKYYNDKPDLATGDLVTITSPSNTPNIDFSLDVGGTISGHVYQSDNITPIVGANIAVYSYSARTASTGGPGTMGSQTAADGSYRTSGFAPGLYAVQVRTGAAGFVAVWYTNSVNAANATSISVVGTNDTPNIDFALQPGGAISGHITTSDNVTPIPWMYVQANDAVTGLNFANGIADPTGNYTIYGLPAGTYKVRTASNIRGQGYFDKWYNNKAASNLGDVVSVTVANTTSNINFSLDTGSTISGYVYQSDNITPIVGAIVAFYDYTLKQWLTSGNLTTDANGHYQSWGLTPGNYLVRASLPGSNNTAKFYDNSLFQVFGKPVTVNPEQDTPNINISLNLGGTISGYVYRSDNVTPIVGATVDFFDFNGKQYAPLAVTTDTNGHYKSYGLPAGTYQVRVRLNNSMYHVAKFYNNAYFSNLGAAVTVSQSQDTPNINFSLETGGTISGHIYQSDNTTPIVNASVSFYDNVAKLWTPIGVSTDINGYYKSFGMPAGSYLVRASIAGTNNVVKFYNNAYFQNLGTPVSINATQDTPNINLSLDIGGTISGYVYRSDNTTPIVNAGLSFYDNIAKQWAPLGYSTDYYGHYKSYGMPAGSYLVQAAGMGFVAQYYLNVPSSTNATVIPVTTANDTPNINFGLLAGGSISGRVTLSDNVTPIYNIQVQALNSVSGAVVASINTDASGSYTIPGLPTGSYKVRTNAANTNLSYFDKWYNNRIASSLGDAVAVTAPNTTSNINFSLEAGSTISGHVYQSDNATPIANAVMSFYDNTAKQWLSGTVTTNNSGAYRSSGMAPGSYLVRASMPNSNYVVKFYNNSYFQSLASAVTVNATQDTPNIDISLNSGGTISGYVFRSDNVTPISGATVDFYDNNAKQWTPLAVSTNGSGYYKSYGLPAGIYLVRARLSGSNYIVKFYNNANFQSLGATVSVSLAQDTPNVNFGLDVGGTISGRVYRSDNITPISGASINFWDNNANQWTPIGATSDVNGNYKSTYGLPVGSYLVQASVSGYNSEYYLNASAGNSTGVSVSASINTPNINFTLDVTVPKPDLVIIDRHENWVVPGVSYAITYTVKNQGTAIAPAGHATALQVDGRYIEQKVMPVSLAPSANYTDNFNTVVTISDTNDSITVVSDSDNNVDESNETNNSAMYTLAWPPTPDLSAYPITDEWVVPGSQYKVHFSVHNDGNMVASANQSTALMIDGIEVERKPVPVSLASGQIYSDVFNTTVNITGGMDKVIVTADIGNGVAESNENNNSSAYTFAWPQAPDLFVVTNTEMWLPGSNTQYNVFFRVQNNGNAPAPAGHHVQLNVNGLVIETLPIPTILNPANPFNGAFATNVTMSGSSDNVTITTDVFNEVTEGDETNNSLTHVWSAPPPPPQQLPDLTVDTHEQWVVPGSTYKIFFTVRNVGNATASSGWNVGLNVQGTPIEQISGPGSLAPGENWTSSFSANITLSQQGFDYVAVQADVNNVINELDKNNNWRFSTVAWPSKPDLVVYKWEEWLVQGQTYLVHYRINNNGNAIAPAGHDTQLMVDGAVIETRSVPVALNPGQSYQDVFSTNITLTGGVDSISVTTDVNHVVDQSTNNKKTMINTFSWPAKPDLVIGWQREQWVPGHEGTQYYVQYAVQNIGNAVALAGHVVQLQIDGIVTENRTIPNDLWQNQQYAGNFVTNINLSGATDNITVIADIDNQADESIESNNSLSNLWSMPVPGTQVMINAPAKVAIGHDFVANVGVGQVRDFDAANFDVSFDPSVLRLDSVSAGFIGNVTLPIGGWNERQAGRFTIVANVPGLTGANGTGVLAVLHFHVLGIFGQTSNITLSSGVLSNNQAQEIPATWLAGFVQVGVIPGDATGDGNVNALDITEIERIIAHLDQTTPGADANHDGNVNALDITKTERIIVGLDVPAVMNYLGMKVNDQNSPFADLRVRNAVYLSLDRSAITTWAQSTYPQGASKVVSIVNPPVPNPDINRAYDPNTARGLLTQAGYPNGFTCTLYVPTGLEPLAGVIVPYLNAIGINGVVSVMSPSNFSANVSAGNLSFFLTDTSVSWNNTPELLGRLILSNGVENFTGFNSSTFDGLFNSASYMQAEGTVFGGGSASAPTPLAPLFWR